MVFRYRVGENITQYVNQTIEVEVGCKEVGCPEKYTCNESLNVCSIKEVSNMTKTLIIVGILLGFSLLVWSYVIIRRKK
jgi:hypothetical protein